MLGTLLPISFLYAQTTERKIVDTSDDLLVQTPADSLHGERQYIEEVYILNRPAVISQHVDRMSIQVEGTILGEGNTALELLEKSPGVSIQSSGEISIKGRTGTSIMINGKKQYLSGDQLVNLLRSTSSSDIAKLEIITNPSAKEDAAGSGGMINIVLKKNIKAGYNAGLSLQTGYGRGLRMGGSLSFNYRTNRLSIFTNYNQYYNNLANKAMIEKIFYDPMGQPTNFVDQYNEINAKLRSNNFRGGIDYTIDSKNSIGLLIHGGLGRYPTDEPSVNDLFEQEGESLTLRTNTSTAGKQRWEDMLYNVHYTHLLNDSGHQLTADLDYVMHFDKMDQVLSSTYQDGGYNTLTRQSGRRGDIPSHNDIYVAKVDYILPLSTYKIEGGWKISKVIMENDLKYDTLQYGQYVADLTTSNHFKYSEQIQAAYANINKSYGSWQFQFGIRGEYTSTLGNQFTLGTSSRNSYFRLFPSGFILKSFDQDKMQFSYSRRIQRPSFWDMNPFRVYQDPYSYYEGNPGLSPSMMHYFDIGYHIGNSLYTVLSYSSAQDVVNDILHIETGNVTYTRPQNIGSSSNLGLSITANTKFSSRWNATNVFNLYRNAYDLTADDQRSGNTLSINSQQTYDLGKGWKAELNGFWYSGGVSGILEYKSRFQLNTGVQKNVFSDRGTVKLVFNDITQSSGYRYVSRYNQALVSSRKNPDNRYVLLSFAYRLGQLFEHKEGRNTGADELKGRLK
ncbi:TonB-dependent receptor [Sphingobacterium sp. SGG-5]|uniref:outer membrane beta-barrel family protein n=1 Tax=Sphingobacterium sp. SGG-5 TaxID=2710881 RepID=UPI0013EB0AA7|nr:outer membrane beta-barrel family protein [Sphingobacterium sp. SGG-5]NGM63357.1 TonB-dependent receptor [Sphingobacterium sp. SGG-5]